MPRQVGGGVFVQGIKMSERSEFFFPEERYPHPPAAAPSRAKTQ